MNGKLFSFHRNWEIVFRQISAFYLKCKIRLKFTELVLSSPSQVLRLWTWVGTPLCTYVLMVKGGRGEDITRFCTVVPLGFKAWDLPITFLSLSTKWPWKHFRISFSNTVFQKFMFYFKSKTRHLKSKHFLKGTVQTGSCD